MKITILCTSETHPVNASIELGSGAEGQLEISLPTRRDVQGGDFLFG